MIAGHRNHIKSFQTLVNKIRITHFQIKNNLEMFVIWQFWIGMIKAYEEFYFEFLSFWIKYTIFFIKICWILDEKIIM